MTCLRKNGTTTLNLGKFKDILIYLKKKDFKTLYSIFLEWKRFYAEFGIFILYFFLFSLVLVLNRIYFSNLVEKYSNGASNSTDVSANCFVNSDDEGTHANDACRCLMLYPTDNLRYVINYLIFQLLSLK
jgi:hypothetical protein